MDIYTITTVKIIHTSAFDTKSRCVGFFTKLKKAKEAVKYNYGNIYENGYYPFCVIERLREGLYNVTTDKYWYKWDLKKSGYIKIKEPEYFKIYLGWGIG